MRILLLFLFVFPVHAQASEWNYEIEPYLMATSIDGDASMGRVTGIDLSVDMKRIMESLDMAAMVHFEALNDSGWGVILDYGFMDLSDDVSGARGGVVDASLRQGVFEGMLFKRQALTNGTLDYFGGVRWWDNDIEVEIDPAVLPGAIGTKIKEDWVDLVVGLRWRHQLNENWQLNISGDIGGFGIDADLTSSVSLGAIFNINDRFSLDMRYKGTLVDYETGTRGVKGYYEYDTITHGPLLGLIIKL